MTSRSKAIRTAIARIADYSHAVGDIGGPAGEQLTPTKGDVARSLHHAGNLLADPSRLWALVPSWLEDQAPPYQPTGKPADAVALLTFVADARVASTLPHDNYPAVEVLLTEAGGWRLAAQIVAGEPVPSPTEDLVAYCAAQAWHPQATVTLNGQTVRVDAEIASLVAAVNRIGATTVASSAGRTLIPSPARLTFQDTEKLTRFVNAAFGSDEPPADWTFNARLRRGVDRWHFLGETTFPLTAAADTVAALTRVPA